MKCIRRPNVTWTRCVCPPCKRRTAWALKRHRNGHLPRVPSESAWERVDELVAQGYEPAWIESAAGVSDKLIQHALETRRRTGHQQAFGRVNSHKLVTANMDTATAGRRSVTGTRRRLRALAVQGWTLDDLSGLSGVAATSLRAAQAGATGLVGAELWRAARDLYDTLSESSGGSALGRTRALNRGWLGPEWWDDPDTDPDPLARLDDVDTVVVDRVLAGDYALARTLRRPERHAVIVAWLEDGRSTRSLEKATGWNVLRDRRVLGLTA